MKKLVATASGRSEDDPANIGGFEIVKIVRQFVPIKPGEGGRSMGEALDAQLEEAAMNGDEIRSIELTVSESWWNDYAAKVNNAAPIAEAYDENGLR